MAASPRFKVYDREGDYQAACKEPEAAAFLCTLYGLGSTVRVDHKRTVWKEGSEATDAGESYDQCAETIIDRTRNPSLSPW